MTIQQTLWYDRDGIQTLSDVTADYHKGNPQSVAAHKTATKTSQRAKNAILGHLARSNGLSCESLEGLTGLSHQSCSARISELRRDGRIIKTGVCKTRSGCQAAIYKIL